MRTTRHTWASNGNQCMQGRHIVDIMASKPFGSQVLAPQLLPCCLLQLRSRGLCWRRLLLRGVASGGTRSQEREQLACLKSGSASGWIPFGQVGRGTKSPSGQHLQVKWGLWLPSPGACSLTGFPGGWGWSSYVAGCSVAEGSGDILVEVPGEGTVIPSLVSGPAQDVDCSKVCGESGQWAARVS